MATCSNILALKVLWTVWKCKMIWHRKMSSPGWKVSDMLLQKSRTITNSSRKNRVTRLKQKWHSVVDVSSGERKVGSVKNNTASERGMLGPWIKVNWMRASRRWQDWTSTSYESVNWNGQEWANLIQMTIISTTVSKNPFEKKEYPS